MVHTVSVSALGADLAAQPESTIEAVSRTRFEALGR